MKLFLYGHTKFQSDSVPLTVGACHDVQLDSF